MLIRTAYDNSHQLYSLTDNSIVIRSRYSPANDRRPALYMIVFNNQSGAFYSYSLEDHKKVFDLILEKVSQANRLVNPPDTVYDLIGWGIPTIAMQPDAINQRYTELESVSYTDIFHSDSNMPITYTAKSKDTSVANARIVESSTSVVISGVAAGSTEVEVTATNQYGAKTCTINVTITS